MTPAEEERGKVSCSTDRGGEGLSREANRSYKTHRPHERGHANSDPPGFLPPHGNYRDLLAYQKAEVVYDITFRFCQRYLSKGDRTNDQMVQAARSGKQNIAEGSKASGTSKETEIKLTNVAAPASKSF